MATENEMKQALLVAAEALEIASDWNFHNAQCNPPKEWGLECSDEDTDDGWCDTYALAKKLREIASCQEACDHDWEDIGSGQLQCTYPECQLVITK